MPGRSRFLGIARRYRPGGHPQTRCRRLISRGGVCWCGRIFRRCGRLGDGGGRRFFLCRSCWGGRGWLGCRRIWAWDGFRGKFGGALVKVYRRFYCLWPGKSPPSLCAPSTCGLRCAELWRTSSPPFGRRGWRRGESNQGVLNHP